VLGAVNAAVLRPIADVKCARFRALTAPPRSAVLAGCVMPLELLTLTPHFERAYPAVISFVSS
jgi:hypothetical protein